MDTLKILPLLWFESNTLLPNRGIERAVPNNQRGQLNTLNLHLSCKFASGQYLYTFYCYSASYPWSGRVLKCSSIYSGMDDT